METHYFRRVLERTWSMTLADVGLEKPRQVVAKLVWSAVTLAILWYVGALEQVISEFGKGGATLFAFVVLIAIFYVANIVRAAAAMQSEAENAVTELRMRLDDQAGRQAAIDALWELRSDGISHRNGRVQSDEEWGAWRTTYEQWRENVLLQCGRVNPNLRQYVARLDRMAEGPPDIMTRVFSSEHGRLVRIMSEMLQRLQAFLTKDLYT
jgi:hypothetical protein